MNYVEVAYLTMWTHCFMNNYSIAINNLVLFRSD